MPRHPSGAGNTQRQAPDRPPFQEHAQRRTFRSDWIFAGIGDHTMEPFGLLADDGSPLSVSLRRLRLSEQVLNHRARQNSDSVSEDVTATATAALPTSPQRRLSKANKMRSITHRPPYRCVR